MKIYSKKAFTLIELLVSITILTMILVAVMAIYVSSSDVSIKSDINRVMQENIKSTIERISEDIRDNGVVGVSVDIPDTDCTTLGREEGLYRNGNKLCTPGFEYFLGAEDIVGNWMRRDNEYCEIFTNSCSLILKEGTEILGPITNNQVSVKSLNFYIHGEPVEKVTISITMQPATRKGLKSELVKSSIFQFQTSISHRPF